MSDLDYLVTITDRLDAVIRAAIDWITVDEADAPTPPPQLRDLGEHSYIESHPSKGERSAAEVRAALHATEGRVRALAPILGARLVDLVTRHEHPAPQSWGAPLVGELQALTRDGPRSSLGKLQERYHYLLNVVMVEQGPTGLTPSSAPPEPEPPDPYAELRNFAGTTLKGQERAVIEALCDAGGELPIADIAQLSGVGWSDPFKGFGNVQQRLNQKLRWIGYSLKRQDNAAKLNQTRAQKSLQLKGN